MRQYLDMLVKIRTEGVKKEDRTGTGTHSIFGHQMRFDLSKGFPLLTTKHVSFHSIAHELIWFMRGDTRLKYLKDNRVSIWDQWVFPGTEVWGDKLSLAQRAALAKRVGKDKKLLQFYDYLDVELQLKGEAATEALMSWFDSENIPAHELLDGELGPVYGAQWRSWPAPNKGCVDQLANVIEQLKQNPDGRRHIVSAWNPAQIEDMALPPCHTLFQFYVADNKLSCQLYQRSADTLLGVPYNIASYSLLTHIVAHLCNYEVGEFIWTGGDCHIYLNHQDAVNEQVRREPTSLPSLEVLGDFTIDTVNIDNFKLHDYNPQEAIRAPVAV